MGSAASTIGRPRLLLVSHSSDEPRLRELLHASGHDHFDDDVLVLTEKYPRDLDARARVLGAAAAALVAVGPRLQRSPDLLESLSFLKDRRRRIVAGPIAFFTRPSGAVGAICTAYGQWYDQLFSPSETGDGDKTKAVHDELREQYEPLRAVHVADILTQDQEPFVDAEVVESDASASTTQQQAIAFISTADGSNDAARIVNALSTLESQGVALAGRAISVSSADTPVATSLAVVHSAAAIVVVITADLSDSSAESANSLRTYRMLVEAARAWRKPLLPVKDVRANVFGVDGWLPLTLAGRLWYQVDANDLGAVHTPYAEVEGCPCKVSDSCPATDFLLSANAVLECPWRQHALEGISADPHSSVDEWEDAMLAAAVEGAELLGLSSEKVQSVINCVDEQLDPSGSITPDHASQWAELGVPASSEEVCAMLDDDLSIRKSEWPTLASIPPSPQAVDGGLGRIRYTVTRIDFKALPPVVDTRGVFIPGSAPDVLLSYQWGSQARVLDVHMQGRVRGLRAWLDVFGHMQGNVNAAMARAVEGVACVVVFVTKAYVASINCRLEFEYAAERGKPMLLAFLDDDPADYERPQWMQRPQVVDAIDLRVQADDTDLDAMALLFTAVRAFVALRAAHDQRRPPVAVDGSPRLFAISCALRTAVDSNVHAAAGSGSASAAVPCSRCGLLFRPHATDADCRRHSAYYLGGGSLMSGRWVCCQEPLESGPGCIPAPHMAQPRVWTMDPDYGTFTWSPDADNS